MTRIYFDQDEWYPVLLPTLKAEDTCWPDTFVDVPQELVDRYDAALKEWVAVQAQLGKLFDPEHYERWWPAALGGEHEHRWIDERRCVDGGTVRPTGQVICAICGEERK